MKKLFTLFFILFTGAVFAQDCDSFFPMKEGNVMEMYNYDGKNKLTSINTMKIKSRTESNGTVEAKIDLETKDAKTSKLNNAETTAKCDGNVLYMDFKEMFASSSVEKQKGTELKMEGDYIEIPRSIKVGDALKDYFVKMRMMQDGAESGVFNIYRLNRKVDAFEKVTVPAGTFDCYKISSTGKTEMEVFGKKINMPAGKSAEWYAIGVGLVKSEIYDKSGKLTYYSVLNSLKK
jgi:hypothetical protein